MSESGTNLVKTLTRTYAKLVGEYEFAERMVESAIGVDAIMEAGDRCEARKKEIDKTLEAIEIVIWLFDPKWDPAKVRPNYPRQKFYGRGDLSKPLFAVLRDAEAPLTRREIAREIARRLGLPKPTTEEIRRIENAIQTTLYDRRGRAIQIVSRHPNRYALIEREKVKAGTNKRVRSSKIRATLPNLESERPIRRPALSETR